MKRAIVLGLVAIVIGTSYIGWKTFSQISRASAVDTGSYFIGYENSTGIYHDKAWSAAQLASYIGAGVGWNNASLTWTGSFVQNGSGYGVVMNNFSAFKFQNLGSYIAQMDSMGKFVVQDKDSHFILYATDGGPSGVDSVKINNSYYLPPADGASGQFIKTDGSGHLSFGPLSAISSLGLVTSYNGTGTQGNGLKVIRSNNDATGQTGPIGSFTGFAVPALETFEVQGYVNITSVSTDILNMNVVFIDENNIGQTLTLTYAGGSTGMGAIKYYSLMPVTIRAKGGTAIVVTTAFATGGGSITYDLGATITQLD